MIFIPLILIAVGLWQLLSSGDLAWSHYENRMRSRGIVSLQRTSEWETQRKIGGVAAIIIGIISFFVIGNLESKTRSSYSPPEGGIWVDGTPVSREQARGMGLPIN